MKNDAQLKADEPPVELNFQGKTAFLTLNRPRVGNALSAALVEAIGEALDAAFAANARLIVFRGAGRHLCTGFDLAGLETQSDGDLLLRFVRIEQLLQRIGNSPVTTVAVASGRTYGAGADIFVACDRRIALPGTQFAFPGSGFGIVLGTGRLAQRIGSTAARRVLLDGTPLSVESALELGLATEICEERALPDLISGIARSAERLSLQTVLSLHEVTNRQKDDLDLSALVRSASAPGLHRRIEAYAASVRKVN